MGGNNNSENRRKSSNSSSSNFKKHPAVNDYSLEDLTSGKPLDVVVAALLLSGKLKVDGVQLFRESPALIVTLIGKFGTGDDNKNNNTKNFSQGTNGWNDVFDVFQQRTQKGDDS